MKQLIKVYLILLLFFGTSQTAFSITPETGWWWSIEDRDQIDDNKTSKSGFNIEQQGKTIVFAAYMYENNGNPIWYLAVMNRKDGSEDAYEGDLTEFENGATLDTNKPGRAIPVSPGKVELKLTSPTDGILTLVNREIEITRFIFSKDENIDPNKLQVRFDLTQDGTRIGDIIVDLNREQAPAMTENFLKYVDANFYDGTILHRVVNDDPDKVIQGGGFLPGLEEKKFPETLGKSINNEATNLKNLRGTIAMTYFQGRPNTITSQFFFNIKNNPDLDRDNSNPGYPVFGTISEGLTVLDKIAKTPVQDVGNQDHVPTTDIVITRLCQMPC